MESKQKSALTIIALVLLAAAIIGGGILLKDKKSEIGQLKTQNEALNSDLRARDSLFNDLSGTFDQIEQNLTFVREKRGQLSIAFAEGKKSRKDLIVADVKLMNDMLFESSKKIDELDKRIKASGFEIQSFKKRIEALNKNIMEQDESIKNLTAELEQRNAKINDMDQQMQVMHSEIVAKDDSLNVKSQAIVARDNELNKAYFISGSFRELKDLGIVKREGGLLGLGTSKLINQEVDNKKFELIDQRSDLTIPIHSKKAKVITEHPGMSYQLVREGDQIAYLQIKDPAEFWKLTTYLVVVK